MAAAVVFAAVPSDVFGKGKFRVPEMAADGVTYDLSYEGRRLGIYRSIDIRRGVKLPEFVKDLSRVKYRRHRLKLFPERSNRSIDNGREMRKPTLEQGQAEPGFNGRVTSIERLTGSNVTGDATKKTWREKAWRGERVNCQGVVWTDKPLNELRLTVSPLVSTDGSKIDRCHMRTRFVRYVVSNTNYKNSMGVRVRDDHLVGDILDDALAYDLPKNGYRPFWLTVDVPQDAKPGHYHGTLKATGEGVEPISFRLELDVCARELPRPSEWKFFLDLWQTPWSIAEFHQVPPFSDIHWDLLKPHLKALADCGQKVITTRMCTVFTAKGWGMPRSMIVDRIWKNGRREFDFTIFDRYVELARSCGVGPQIHIYSLVTFGNRPEYIYTDGETGAERVLKVKVGDPEYETHMGPKLAAIERHVAEKDWLEDTYIALDELTDGITQQAVHVLKKYAPKLKTASAGMDVNVDVFSQALQGDDGSGWGKHALLPPNYPEKVAQRRSEGKITTYYICQYPEKPNTFMDSPLVESRWLGQYAASAGFDGLLRWSVHLWNRDPFYDSSLGAYNHGEPGDRHLMYPRALWSTRMETVRDGIEDFEKIRILRESGADMTAIDAALKHISTDDINADEESDTILKVASVVDAIVKTSEALQ